MPVKRTRDALVLDKICEAVIDSRMQRLSAGVSHSRKRMQVPATDASVLLSSTDSFDFDGGRSSDSSEDTDSGSNLIAHSSRS